MNRPVGWAAIGIAALAVVAGTTGISSSSARAEEEPFLRSELVFPLDALHNHASCVVECPDGDLLVCWYRGSGERSADDVEVLGARKRSGRRGWSDPFPMADVPGFPDCNPAMIVDPRRKLWLFWPTIQANEWHTALLRYKVSGKYEGAGAPVWSEEKVLHPKPGEEFARIVNEAVERDLASIGGLPAAERDRTKDYLDERRRNGRDRYFVRLGWMPRAHPYILDGKRLILPLYSDGFDFSLMAITDDWGKTWSVSQPLVSRGGVQPSIARKRDGTLATYMRDNGPPPKRLLYSESADRGRTWADVRDSDIPNSGAGAEVIDLRGGRWALINNDTERGRHRLSVWISDDDGKSWRWKRALEADSGMPGSGSYGYPSIIQARDGSLHATYTFNPPDSQVKVDEKGRRLRASIKHAHFNEAWVMAGAG